MVDKYTKSKKLQYIRGGRGGNNKPTIWSKQEDTKHHVEARIFQILVYVSVSPIFILTVRVIKV